MKIRTLGLILLAPALVGMSTWSFLPHGLLSIVLRSVVGLSRFYGVVYAILLLIVLAGGSYYAVRGLSKRRFLKMALSPIFSICLLASFYGGAYLGELWAVYDAKSYLDGVVRFANEYLQKHGEYPESLDKLDLPPAPRLVRESGNRKENSAYFFITPYRRIDSRSIEVGFGYAKPPDECASYTWTTNEPRWVCW
jgi:hypothetical protein